MPAKRKADAQPSGALKKSSLGTKYGGGVKKNRDKYGFKGYDADEMIRIARLVESSTSKQINKNIETQYSSAVIVLTGEDTGASTSGFRLYGLNDTATGAAGSQEFTENASQCMIFNLCTLSQPGSSIQPGYRQGQRINALYINVSITGYVLNPTADLSYHWAIVRRKNDQQNQNAYGKPTLVDMSYVGLYKPLTDGPLCAESLTALTGAPKPGGATTSSVIPLPYHMSSCRRNTDQWTFIPKGHGSFDVRPAPMDVGAAAGPVSDVVTSSINASAHLPIGQEWDFVQRNGTDLKGGNYFLVMWREGSPWVEKASIPTSLGPVEQLKVKIELAFKDA